MRVAGSRPPKACGPGLQGAWGPERLGPQKPAPQADRGLWSGLQEARRDPSRRGLWARSPGGLGPGAFSHKNHPPLKLRFFANLLAGAWRRRGCRLKRLLRRWGPGGKRSRDTPPTPPPPTPPAFWGCKGEKKRVFTLSAFGNHPTRPPRSADLVPNGLESATFAQKGKNLAKTIHFLCSKSPGPADPFQKA